MPVSFRTKSGVGLGKWMSNIRTAYRQKQRGKKMNKQLTDGQVKVLEKLGIDWKFDSSSAIKGKEGLPSSTTIPSSTTQDTFFERFKELSRFKIEQGHCSVPADHELFKWCEEVRVLNDKGKLSKNEVNMLRAAGFHMSTFQDCFEEIAEFASDHNHCKIPIGHPCYQWCKEIRAMKSAHKLDEDEFLMLQAINFEWKADSTDASMYPSSRGQGTSSQENRVHDSASNKDASKKRLKGKKKQKATGALARSDIPSDETSTDSEPITSLTNASKPRRKKSNTISLARLENSSDDSSTDSTPSSLSKLRRSWKDTSVESVSSVDFENSSDDEPTPLSSLKSGTTGSNGTPIQISRRARAAESDNSSDDNSTGFKRISSVKKTSTKRGSAAISPSSHTHSTSIRFKANSDGSTSNNVSHESESDRMGCDNPKDLNQSQEDTNRANKQPTTKPKGVLKMSSTKTKQPQDDKLSDLSEPNIKSLKVLELKTCLIKLGIKPSANLRKEGLQSLLLETIISRQKDNEVV